MTKHNHMIFTHKKPTVAIFSAVFMQHHYRWRIMLLKILNCILIFKVLSKPNNITTNFRFYLKNIILSTYKCTIKRTLLTETNASVTLVRTEGRNEWMRILCSVTANTSRVTAFSGPRFWSSVENLPPLFKNINTLVSYKWPEKIINNKIENKVLEKDFINLSLQIFLSNKTAKQTTWYISLSSEE